MDVLLWLLWVGLFAAWVVGGILSIVDLTKRLHAPVWVVVLYCVAVVVLPIVTVAISWIVIGIIRLGRSRSSSAVGGTWAAPNEADRM